MRLIVSESPGGGVVLAGGRMLFSRRRAILFSLLLVFLAPLNASERDNGPDPDRRSGIRRINQAPPSEDCLQFNCESIPSEISPDNVTQLDEAWRVLLPDIADGSPIYVSNVIADFAQRDLLILGTMSGSVVAVDAQRGNIVWTVEHHAGPMRTEAPPPRSDMTLDRCPLTAAWRLWDMFGPERGYCQLSPTDRRVCAGQLLPTRLGGKHAL